MSGKRKVIILPSTSWLLDPLLNCLSIALIATLLINPVISQLLYSALTLDLPLSLPFSPRNVTETAIVAGCSTYLCREEIPRRLFAPAIKLEVEEHCIVSSTFSARTIALLLWNNISFLSKFEWIDDENTWRRHTLTTIPVKMVCRVDYSRHA